MTGADRPKVVWIGKLAGTMIFEPVLERTGYKIMMYIICAIQAVAIIIERKSLTDSTLQAGLKIGAQSPLKTGSYFPLVE